jgi:hypothetical protein
MTDRIRYFDALNRPVETRVTKHVEGYIVVSETLGEPLSKRIIASYDNTRIPRLHSRGLDVSPVIWFELTREDVMPILKAIMKKECPTDFEDEPLPWTETELNSTNLKAFILDTRSRYLYGLLPVLQKWHKVSIGGEMSWNKMLDILLTFFSKLPQDNTEIGLLS